RDRGGAARPCRGGTGGGEGSAAALADGTRISLPHPGKSERGIRQWPLALAICDPRGAAAGTFECHLKHRGAVLLGPGPRLVAACGNLGSGADAGLATGPARTCSACSAVAQGRAHLPRGDRRRLDSRDDPGWLQFVQFALADLSARLSSLRLPVVL